MNFRKLYIEKLVYPAMNVFQDSRVTRFTKELQESERMPADQQTAQLRQKLSELLLLCRSRVPVYRGLSFTDLDLRREPLDCLQAVDPILLEDLLGSASEFLRQDVDLSKLERRVCGGPQHASIYLTREQIERCEAARWRGLSWYGVTYGSPSVLLWDRPHSPFVLQEEPYMKNRLSLSVCAMTNRTVELTVRQIERFQPEYITGSITALRMMADAMQRAGSRLRAVPKVVTVTKGLAQQEDRERLSEAFGCPVAQVLSGRVEGMLAYMCPAGHLHITAEHCCVELLDPKTWNPVSPGQPGLVTVTNLLNETMPQLRVILDYTAVLSGEPCPCGRTLPVLEQLHPAAPA